MLTEDPATPGPGNWEINSAFAYERVNGQPWFEAPLLDINYGVGERFQLKYELPFIISDPGNNGFAAVSAIRCSEPSGGISSIRTPE
jgi:hypothetical protein